MVQALDRANVQRGWTGTQRIAFDMRPTSPRPSEIRPRLSDGDIGGCRQLERQSLKSARPVDLARRARLHRFPKISTGHLQIFRHAEGQDLVTVASRMAAMHETTCVLRLSTWLKVWINQWQYKETGCGRRP